MARRSDAGGPVARLASVVTPPGSDQDDQPAARPMGFSLTSRIRNSVSRPRRSDSPTAGGTGLPLGASAARYPAVDNRRGRVSPAPWNTLTSRAGTPRVTGNRKSLSSCPPSRVEPFQPAAFLKWLFGFPGYLWPHNALLIGMSAVTWFFLTPPLPERVYSRCGPTEISLRQSRSAPAALVSLSLPAASVPRLYRRARRRRRCSPGSARRRRLPHRLLVLPRHRGFSPARA